MTQRLPQKPSKSQKESQIPYEITYTWNLKYNTNKHIYKIEIYSDVENRFVVAKGEQGWEEKDWKFETSKYKLLYILQNG